MGWGRATLDLLVDCMIPVPRWFLDGTRSGPNEQDMYGSAFETLPPRPSSTFQSSPHFSHYMNSTYERSRTPILLRFFLRSLHTLVLQLVHQAYPSTYIEERLPFSSFERRHTPMRCQSPVIPAQSCQTCALRQS